MVDHPLLEQTTLPPFNQIKIKSIKPALETQLENNRKQLRKLLRQQNFSWENLLAPLEEMEDELNNLWAPVEQLNATMNSPKLRKVYNECLTLLVHYQVELSHNKKLYRAINEIAKSDAFKKLNTAQKRTIKNALRDFKLSGAELAGKKKKRFAELQEKLSKLSTQFEENILDCTNAWSHQVKRKTQLKGLPEFIIQAARTKAKAKGVHGWLLMLDFPTYLAVMQYADNQKLRKVFYEAFTTRASDQGPHDKKWDNSAIMPAILQARTELAHLLGFNNYAELSLATKMAKDTQQVMNFLEDLAHRSKPQAEKEFKALERFAIKHYQVKKLEAWDVAYYAEKMRLHQFSLSSEQLRPYFPEPVVMRGLFQIVEKLYGIQIESVSDFESWHEDVNCYAIYDRKHRLIAYFYTDLYARPNKRGGAWMADCRNHRIRLDGSKQIPVAFLNCNFNQPSEDHPCLMTHDEVLTVFHEFGHGLHHMLTKVNVASVSGINGVAWDAVELPSQFMENWCWEPEAIPLISKHYQTKKPLPKTKLNKLLKAKNFNSALMMMRQLEFSLFDFRLHLEPAIKTTEQIQSVLDQVREETAVMQPPAFNRFQHGFAHIFAGGYAAGYYSYKWAEVLSSDAFSRFEAEGLFNQETGKSFLKHILQRGGEMDMTKLFKKFRGRDASIDALLKHSGIG